MMILLTLSEDNQTSPNISYDSCGLIDDRCDIIHKKRRLQILEF